MPKRKLAKEVSVVETNGAANDAVVNGHASKPPTSKRRKVEKIKEEVLDEAAANKITTVKAKRKTTKEVKYEDPASDNEIKASKPQRKRKTKEEKAAEEMPLAARTAGHKLFIGAHVSAAGGVHNSVVNSVHIGGNAFALFLKSQRKWANPPLADDTCTSFHSGCKAHAYDQTRHVVPHGSYLVNLAHTDPERTEQAYTAFLDDLQRCERLGIKLYNFHPGVANSVGDDRHAAIAHLASNINRAHRDTSSVITLLENMAHGGKVLGSTFEDLRDTIALVDDKSRVGVCLDTCHAFAGGYDLRTPTAFAATMDSFEEIVSTRYLRAVHMNDSKAPFASHRDLHANIGTGFLGLRAFHNLVNDVRFEGIPLILETPIEARDADGTPVKDEKGKVVEDRRIWAEEIKLLESLVGMDAEGEEFRRLEEALARKGRPERERMMDAIDKKAAKDAAKMAKGMAKGGKPKKRKKVEDEAESSELSDLSDDAESDANGDTQRLQDR